MRLSILWCARFMEKESATRWDRISGSPAHCSNEFPQVRKRACTRLFHSRPKQQPANMKICQSHLGQRSYSRPDWTNLSSVLAQVLGRCFWTWNDTRRTGNARVVRRRFRNSASRCLSRVRRARWMLSRLIESFQLGARNLPEVWGMILPPSTLVELRRLARQETAGFRMPDEMWARIIYDFALAHRLAHDQPGSDASRADADLPGLGRLVRARTGKRLAGGCRAAAGTAMRAL